MYGLKRTTIYGLAVALVCAFGITTSPSDAAAGWEPKKPVEFIIMAGKGGGADKMARLMQAIIEKKRAVVEALRADQQARRLGCRSADSSQAEAG